MLLKSGRTVCEGSSYRALTKLSLVQNETRTGISQLTLQYVSNDFNGAAPHVQNLMDSLTDLMRKEKEGIFIRTQSHAQPHFFHSF